MYAQRRAMVASRRAGGRTGSRSGAGRAAASGAALRCSGGRGSGRLGGRALGLPGARCGDETLEDRVTGLEVDVEVGEAVGGFAGPAVRLGPGHLVGHEQQGDLGIVGADLIRVGHRALLRATNGAAVGSLCAPASLWGAPAAGPVRGAGP